HVAFGDLLFRYREDRLAVGAIQHIDIALLGWLGDRLDGLAVVRKLANDPGAADIAVPQAVMDHLVMPFAQTRLDIERHQTFAKQIGAGAGRPRGVGLRQFYADINQAKLRIRRHGRPGAGIARSFRLARCGPGVVAEFTLARDGVEDPFALAGPDIEAAYVTFGCHGRCRAHHHRILHHQRRRVQADDAPGGIHLLVVIQAQVYAAAFAEIRIGDARLGVQ